MSNTHKNDEHADETARVLAAQILQLKQRRLELQARWEAIREESDDLVRRRSELSKALDDVQNLIAKVIYEAGQSE